MSTAMTRNGAREREFRRIAIELSLLEVGKPMDSTLLEYALRVAELCATLEDSYSVVGKGNAGDHIRTRYVLPLKHAAMRRSGL